VSERGSQCEQVKKDGQRCNATARPGSPFCTFHDPAMREACKEGRKAGGVARKAPTLPSDSPDLPLASSADVARLVAAAINQTRRGELDPKVANAVGYLSGVLLKALEESDLEARLAKLEERALGAGSPNRNGNVPKVSA
jgi:hypothetical protein